MIVFDLKCERAGHVFEAWFGSSADFEEQRSRGLVACPLCGDAAVGKAVMAPRIGGSGDEIPVAMGQDEAAKAALAALALAQQAALRNSTYVGSDFAKTARALHDGGEARAIHGTATATEAEALRDDGIAVAPLPLPIIPPEQAN